jgi:hypothetical protein
VYLTVRNFSNAGPTDYELTLDLDELGWDEAEVIRLLDDAPVETRLEGAILTIRGHIEPATTHAFRLTKSG